MKLYTMPGTCSLGPNIAVAWEDAPIDVVTMEYGHHKSPEYLEVNPRGQVPALQFDDGSVLTEANAILEYIGAAHGGDNHAKFTRDTELGRGEAECLSYLSSELHATFKGHFAPQAFADSDEGQEQVKKKVYERLDGQFQGLNDQIAETDGPYLRAEKSYADAMLYAMARWIDKTPLDINDYPNIDAHQKEMEADDGVQLALQRQKMKPLQAS